MVAARGFRVNGMAFLRIGPDVHGLAAVHFAFQTLGRLEQGVAVCERHEGGLRSLAEYAACTADGGYGCGSLEVEAPSGTLLLGVEPDLSGLHVGEDGLRPVLNLEGRELDEGNLLDGDGTSVRKHQRDAGFDAGVDLVSFVDPGAHVDFVPFANIGLFLELGVTESVYDPGRGAFGGHGARSGRHEQGHYCLDFPRK